MQISWKGNTEGNVKSRRLLVALIANSWWCWLRTHQYELLYRFSYLHKRKNWFCIHIRGRSALGSQVMRIKILVGGNITNGVTILDLRRVDFTILVVCLEDSHKIRPWGGDNLQENVRQWNKSFSMTIWSKCNTSPSQQIGSQALVV